jgi:carbon monoxide dehydrogenase subunit G
MKIEQSFTVDLPVADVWAGLTDIERIAPCLPGAEITGSDDEGTYHGLFTVKIGPMTAKYRGTLKMEEVEEAGHTARMRAHGTDTRGQGGANAEIVSTLAETNGGTRVDVVTDLTLSGKVARFGRGGMIEDVSRHLMGEFSACLEKRIASAPAAAVPDASPSAPDASPAAPDASPAEPINAIRLALRLLLARIRRLFRRSSG